MPNETQRNGTFEALRITAPSAVAFGVAVFIAAGGYYLNKAALDRNDKDIALLQAKTEVLNKERELHAARLQLLEQELRFISAGVARIEAQLGVKH